MPEQLIVDDFALVVGLLVEVEDFDEVGSLAGQFLISHDVHVQLELRVGERGVEVAVDEFLGFEVGHDVAGDRVLVDLGHDVMDGLAVAECLVDRRVEAVEEPQLELVGAFEEVLQVAEAEVDVGYLMPALSARRGAGRGASPACRGAGQAARSRMSSARW